MRHLTRCAWLSWTGPPALETSYLSKNKSAWNHEIPGSMERGQGSYPMSRHAGIGFVHTVAGYGTDPDRARHLAWAKWYNDAGRFPPSRS